MGDLQQDGPAPPGQEDPLPVDLPGHGPGQDSLGRRVAHEGIMRMD
jgi:hypothetical protein